MVDTSIILAYHNEGQEFLEECVKQIQETVKLPSYEVIIVDDASMKPLQPITGTILIRHGTNKGVGGCFDTGVLNASGENIILSACDIRFIDNGWAEKLIEEINAHPDSLICTACVGLNREAPENMDFERRRKALRCFGATILMFHDKKSNPRKEESFRGIIEAKWNTPAKDRTKSYEIPCILGACYGVKKSWYNYIDGFWGHKGWGSLESYVSLKSWMFGGNCLCAPHIETGHIFKREGTHGIKQEVLMYNKMLVATLLLDDSKRLIDFLGNNTILARARKMFDADKNVILAKREEYKRKKVLHEKDFCKQWNIDYRLE